MSIRRSRVKRMISISLRDFSSLFLLFRCFCFWANELPETKYVTRKSNFQIASVIDSCGYPRLILIVILCEHWKYHPAIVKLYSHRYTLIQITILKIYVIILFHCLFLSEVSTVFIVRQFSRAFQALLDGMQWIAQIDFSART